MNNKIFSQQGIGIIISIIFDTDNKNFIIIK
jgi:hypothetical protein